MLLSDMKLKQLCIENGWFDCGTNRQYEKLFYANEKGFTIEEIATIIWLCSDEEKHTRENIIAALQEATETIEEIRIQYAAAFLLMCTRALFEDDSIPISDELKPLKEKYRRFKAEAEKEEEQNDYQTNEKCCCCQQ